MMKTPLKYSLKIVCFKNCKTVTKEKFTASNFKPWLLFITCLT